MGDYAGFELGPIRPPSEAGSLLLRLTRNCPWNRCTFCSVYKKHPFSLRSVEDVIQDIDTLAGFIDLLRNNPGSAELNLQELSPGDEQAFYSARNWLQGGMEAVFLQDADSLVMKPDQVIAVLTHLRECFPEIKRITSYARSATIARISEDHLQQMAAAGLNRIHIGLETASDAVLQMIKKGVSKAQQIEAGVKTRQAGIELSEYVLVGIGGREFSREHALETADALNQINPDFIRFRTLRIPDSNDLFSGVEDCHWQRPSDLVQAEEILLFIQNLDNITSQIKSDHMFNLLQEIDGTLPQDKERLIAALQKFINLPPQERACFQVGKRTGHFLNLSDMQIPSRLAQVEEIYRQQQITPENVDAKLNAMIQEQMRRGMF
jgi:hypothetical protein